MAPSLEEQLERGELVVFPRCPFALPADSDRAILQRQKLRVWTHKNISFNPETQRVTGYQYAGKTNDTDLQRILQAFSDEAVNWIHRAMPRYRSGSVADRASFRSEEEATRRLRPTARNDLLHIDAFPNRPTNQRRILRLYVNIHPTEPRVWVTSDPLARVVERYSSRIGLPSPTSSSGERIGRQGLLKWWNPGLLQRSAYDSFMLRLHDFLKASDDFQERSPKRLWSFPPGSMWMLYTDSLTHAELRGQYALEHSFFINPGVLVAPEYSPAVFLGFAPAMRQKKAA